MTGQTPNVTYFAQPKASIKTQSQNMHNVLVISVIFFPVKFILFIIDVLFQTMHCVITMLAKWMFNSSIHFISLFLQEFKNGASFQHEVSVF